MNFESFNGKEFVESFSFSTTKNDGVRNVVRPTIINGRHANVWGKLQSVTFVGIKYKTADNKYILVVGMSKQNPLDKEDNKELGLEIAAEKSQTNPIITIEVNKHFSGGMFNRLMQLYYDMCVEKDLEFMKTTEERETAKIETVLNMASTVDKLRADKEFALNYTKANY